MIASFLVSFLMIAGKAFNISLSIFAVDFFKIRKFSSICGLLSLYHEWFWILIDAFSASVEIIIFSFIVLMWWITGIDRSLQLLLILTSPEARGGLIFAFFLSDSTTMTFQIVLLDHVLGKLFLPPRTCVPLVYNPPWIPIRKEFLCKTRCQQHKGPEKQSLQEITAWKGDRLTDIPLELGNQGSLLRLKHQESLLGPQERSVTRGPQ